jgi:hypothetical protein
MKHVDAGPMTLTRLAELLDAYGSNPERWPEHERAAGLALLTSEPRASGLQAAARLLDEQLAQFEVSEPSALLQARVLEIPIRHQAKPRSSFASLARFVLPGWRLAAVALIPCALGFLSGVLSNDGSEPDDGWSEVASMTLLGDVVSDVPDEEWP